MAIVIVGAMLTSRPEPNRSPIVETP